jgi:Condensation domain/Phosphopantetheine attachment site
MESTRTDSAAVGVTLKEQALWLLERLVPDIGVNNVPMTFRVDGRLSVAAVERTIALLMRRFETLRTVFYADETELRKRILGPDETTIPVQVIPTGPDEISALRDFVARPFELQSQPLVRAGIQHAADGDVCCVAVHHLIFDAVSAAILFMNFVAVYDAVAAGQKVPAALREPVATLAETPPTEQGLAFWREHLAGFDPQSLDLGIGKRYAGRPTLLGGEHHHALDPQVTKAVRRLQRELRAPESVILYAAFYLLLIAHGADRDLVVGTPVNRRSKEDAGAIGFHISVAPLRARADPDMSFGQLVVQTRDNFLSALEHASVSLDDFMADLSRSSSSWRDTIMRHMFNYMTGPPGQSFVIGGMKGEPVSIFNGFAKSDIEFFVNSAPDGISIRAVYYAELFDQDDVRLLVTRYETLLATLAADVKQPIGELPTWGERPAPTDDGTPPEPAAGYDSELVRELVGLWRQMLGRDDVDARSNFFVKGGHSVLAAQLAHKVGELTGVRPKLADVFAMPTPAELADLIDSRRRETAE